MRAKILILSLAVMAMLYCNGSGEAPATPQPQPKSESLEYKLVTIDKGYVSKDGITITRFRSLLQQLDKSYTENKKQIADMSVMAQNLLRNKHGIKESLMNIMEGMLHLYPIKINPSYAEHATAYVQLRAKGLSHYEAWGGVTTYLKSIGR